MRTDFTCRSFEDGPKEEDFWVGLGGSMSWTKKKPYSDSPSYTDTPLNQEEDRHMMVTEKRWFSSATDCEDEVDISSLRLLKGFPAPCTSPELQPISPDGDCADECFLCVCVCVCVSNNSQIWHFPTRDRGDPAARTHHAWRNSSTRPHTTCSSVLPTHLTHAYHMLNRKWSTVCRVWISMRVSWSRGGGASVCVLRKLTVNGRGVIYRGENILFMLLCILLLRCQVFWTFNLITSFTDSAGSKCSISLPQRYMCVLHILGPLTELLRISLSRLMASFWTEVSMSCVFIWLELKGQRQVSF